MRKSLSSLMILGLYGAFSWGQAQAESEWQVQRLDHADKRVMRWQVKNESGEALHRATQEQQQAMEEARHQLRESSHRATEEQQRAMEEARHQLREASRKLAELHRQNWEGVDQGGERHFSFSFSHDDDQPRLGLVMEPAADAGVKVLSVTPDSPAEQAGLQSGDVITAVNGQRLDQQEPQERLHQFFEELGELNVDTAIKLEYQRGKASAQTVQLTPAIIEGFSFLPFAPNVDVDAILDGVGAAMPFIDILDEGGPGVFQSFHQMRMFHDLELTELDPQLGQYFGAEQGLLVLAVPEEMQQQLQRGDVLLQIDGREPKDVGHAFRILRSYEAGEQVELSVLRQGSTQNVAITLPEASENEREFIIKRRHFAPPMPPTPPNAPTPPTPVRVPPPHPGGSSAQLHTVLHYQT